MSDKITEKLAIVGLGYVGLPIAMAFAEVCDDIVGFDIFEKRVNDLKNGIDATKETTPEELAATKLQFSSDPDSLKDAKFIIVTVPTPITKGNRPDLSPLDQACRAIGTRLTPGATIVFESTVYPTATEAFCGPILAEVSGLECGKDFKLAYSPERINPGDKQHPLTKIVKVVSGQDEETAVKVADLYGRIIEAGVHVAPSIAVAEAAKVIENTQRDLNIALMNEIAMICDRLDIRTMDVIEAAGTKWNFLRFTPGLVGGHCIGVDPYYLTAKAEEIGHHPEVILAGRRINDSMGQYVAHRICKLLAKAGRPLAAARIGVLGLTFKENVPDVRNSKVFDLIDELHAYGIQPLVHDPVAPPEAFERDSITKSGIDAFRALDCVVLAVPHAEFCLMKAADYDAMLNDGGIFIDIKSHFTKADFRPGITYWSL